MAGWRAGWPTCSVAPSALILSTYVCSSAVAASAVTSAVDWLVRRDTGLRDSVCLQRRCDARTTEDMVLRNTITLFI